MALPSLHLLHVQRALRACAQERLYTRVFTNPNIRSVSRSTSSSKTRQRKNDHARLSQNKSLQVEAAEKLEVERRNSHKETRHLVRRDEDGRSLDTGRRPDVPMKVLPKADMTPTLTLSPIERLHVEHLTRRPPPKIEPKVFKERLLIYHAGHARVNWLALWRVAALVGLSAVTFVIVPAHYQYGTPLPVVALIWAAGFVPVFLLNWWYRGIVTHVWLHLPQHARQTAQAGIDYAKSLPRDASLDLSFLRTTALMGNVSLKLCDTVPVMRALRPSTFQWIGPRVNPGTWLRPNPTEFFVRPESAKGKAARDTIPGLWSKVYTKLAGVDADAVAKWRR